MEHNNPDDVGKAENNDVPPPSTQSEAPATEAPATAPTPAATPAQDEAQAPSANPEITSNTVLKAWEAAAARDVYMEDATRAAGERLAQEVRHLQGKVSHLELEARRR